nr:hypothetical protein GCM10017611_01980 [Rhodococcus wratislaviensis]
MWSDDRGRSPGPRRLGGGGQIATAQRGDPMAGKWDLRGGEYQRQLIDGLIYLDFSDRTLPSVK